MGKDQPLFTVDGLSAILRDLHTHTTVSTSRQLSENVPGTEQPTKYPSILNSSPSDVVPTINSGYEDLEVDD